MLLLAHVPPPPSVRAVTWPAHTVAVPVIAEGDAVTVMVFVVIHPVGNVNVIAALPADTPVITPVEEAAVAIAVLLLLHVPPPEASLSVIVEPVHTEDPPDTATGNA